MDEQIKIMKCLKCGGRGFLYQDTSSVRRPYYMKCEHCGNHSKKFLHLEAAIKEWNIVNKPNNVKPTFHCGSCGAEVFLGFAECTKCGTKIDW